MQFLKYDTRDYPQGIYWNAYVDLINVLMKLMPKDEKFWVDAAYKMSPHNVNKLLARVHDNKR
jgi:hypothetical protein